MEMEANVFLSFCNRLEIPSAVVCVTIVNRLNGDQITSTKEELRNMELYPLAMILKVTFFLLSRLVNFILGDQKPTEIKNGLSGIKAYSNCLPSNRNTP